MRRSISASRSAARYYYILASYDDGELSRFGPGAAHLRDLMQRAIERGCAISTSRSATSATSTSGPTDSMALYDHRRPRACAAQPFVVAPVAFRPLKRTIKQTPVLWRVFGRVRAAMAPLIGRRKARRRGAARAAHRAADRAGVNNCPTPVQRALSNRCPKADCMGLFRENLL